MTDTARNGSDMLEKLARTLYESDHFAWGEPDYAVLDEGIQEAYRRAVLKLLDALAEPSGSMLDIGEHWLTASRAYGGSDEDAVRAVWQNILQHIRNGGA